MTTNFYSTFSTSMLCNQARLALARVRSADLTCAQTIKFIRFDGEMMAGEIRQRITGLDDDPACKLAKDCHQALALINNMLSSI